MSSIITNTALFDEMIAKYNQVSIFLNRAETSGNGQPYDITIKPPFEQIATRLYDSIVPDRYVVSHGVEDKQLETCREYPIFTRSRIPTLEEVLDAIKYVPEYEHVYLFITPFNYQLCNFFVSKIIYCVQVGIWIPTGEPLSYVGKQFEPAIIINHDVFKDIRPIVADDTTRKYEYVIPIKLNGKSLDDECEVNRLDKPPLVGIQNQTYMWLENDKSVLGYYDPTTRNIVNASRTATIATLLMESPSLHVYAYYGIFRPSLDEALAAIPNSIFTPGRKFLITTRAARVEVNKMDVDDYHLATTMIWQIEDGANI